MMTAVVKKAADLVGLQDGMGKTAHFGTGTHVVRREGCWRRCWQLILNWTAG